MALPEPREEERLEDGAEHGHIERFVERAVERVPRRVVAWGSAGRKRLDGVEAIVPQGGRVRLPDQLRHAEVVEHADQVGPHEVGRPVPRAVCSRAGCSARAYARAPVPP